MEVSPDLALQTPCAPRRPLWGSVKFSGIPKFLDELAKGLRRTSRPGRSRGSCGCSRTFSGVRSENRCSRASSAVRAFGGARRRRPLAHVYVAPWFPHESLPLVEAQAPGCTDGVFAFEQPWHSAPTKSLCVAWGDPILTPDRTQLFDSSFRGLSLTQNKFSATAHRVSL